jgi:glycerate kinase
MKKIVIAPDSFKGSVTAAEACEAIKRGIRKFLPDAEIISLPMADGGEGTVDALVAATGGTLRHAPVRGPLGEDVLAAYGLLGEPGTKTAIIEMAASSGLPLVPSDQRNPLNTTTYGLGELILDALAQGCKKILLGLGGSATNDGGCGMAQALGARFYNQAGTEIDTYVTGRLAGAISSLDCEELHEVVRDAEFVTACDVTNPLLGENGASYTYGPQKGATPEIVRELDANLAHVYDLIEAETGAQVRDIAGAGAAGGLGAAVLAFLNAKLERGIELVMRESGFDEKIQGADLIITGEGRIDKTSAQGKSLSGIAAAAAKQNIPVIALAGSVNDDPNLVQNIGLRAIIPICDESLPLAQAMAQGKALLEAAAARIPELTDFKTE